MTNEALLEPQTHHHLDEQVVIRLPYGILGFERVKNYCLIAHEQEDPFMWLRMIDSARKSFLIVSPFLVMPDYQPDIPAADVDALELGEPADAWVFGICTIRGPGRATINLRGPLVINRHTLVGKQVIPNNASQYALAHPLPIA